MASTFGPGDHQWDRYPVAMQGLVFILRFIMGKQLGRLEKCEKSSSFKDSYSPAKQ